MARLIDAEALIDELNSRIEAAIKWGVNAIVDRDAESMLRSGQAVATFCEASLTAKKMPTVDAVEVVRCKDCEYWRQDYGLWENVPYCELTATRTDPDFFCSGGERKGE